MASHIFQICFVVVIIKIKFIKNSFDRGLNVAKTVFLLLENGSNYQKDDDFKSVKIFLWMDH